MSRIQGQRKRAFATRRLWASDEERLLCDLYPDTPSKEIAERFRRTLSQIYQRAKRLGLKKSEAYMKSPAACRLRRGDNVGAAFRFKKGQAPVNKGMRRPGWSAGRMRETQFKKGERRGVAAKNWCPIGTIRADGEGFLRIKVREGKQGEAYGFGNTKIWPLLNRHVWEQHNGPIPPSHAVVFKDRDRKNCDISNLELITRRELMARNTVHNLPKELADVIQLKGALKRQITRHERRIYGKEQDARSS